MSNLRPFDFLLQTAWIVAWDLQFIQRTLPKVFPLICASFALRTLAARDGCAATCCSFPVYSTWRKYRPTTFLRPKRKLRLFLMWKPRLPDHLVHATNEHLSESWSVISFQIYRVNAATRKMSKLSLKLYFAASFKVIASLLLTLPFRRLS